MTIDPARREPEGRVDNQHPSLFANGHGNDEDPVLTCVPEDRRAALIAEDRGDGLWWRDIVLQGANETVFFAL